MPHYIGERGNPFGKGGERMQEANAMRDELLREFVESYME